MKSVLLVVFLAAAATAAVVSNGVPDVIGRDEMADVDVNEPEVVVTDLNELADGAEETAVASRRNLSHGIIGSSDALLYDTDHQVNGVAGHVVTREITVRTNRQITAIRVNRIGASQNATPSVVSGGIGNSFVTIRLRSAAGRGFHYNVKIYGR